MDSIEDPKRLEGEWGERAEQTRDTSSRVSAEVGKTLGRIYRSFTAGILSENRPLAEQAADALDKARESLSAGNDKKDNE